MFILILCNDPHSEIFMNAKQGLVGWPVTHKSLKVSEITALRAKHGWQASPTMACDEMDFTVVASGRDQGTCGGGLGTNKNAYERASALALVASTDILEGVYTGMFAPIHKTVMRLKERVSYLTPYAAATAPTLKDYDDTIPDGNA